MIFVGQTNLSIQVTCILEGTTRPVNLTGIESVVIRYQRPDGIKGEWPASVIDAVNGIIAHDVQVSTPPELNIKGLWSIWPFITFAPGKTAPGTSASMKVEEEG